MYVHVSNNAHMCGLSVRYIVFRSLIEFWDISLCKNYPSVVLVVIQSLLSGTINIYSETY